MGKIGVARVRQIGGAYYWRPTKAVKAMGFIPEALGKDFAQAMSRAARLNADVDARKRELEAGPDPHSVKAMIAAYRASSDFKGLSAAARHSYGVWLADIEKTAGHIDVTRITRKDILAVKEAVFAARGIATGRGLMAMWKIILGYAFDRDMIPGNPASELKMPAQPSRHQVWTPDQIEAVCRAAEAQGCPSVALGVRIAYDTALRRRDILRLRWSDWDGAAFRVTQHKTRKPVVAPALSELRAKLNGMARDGLFVLICEMTGRPWVEHSFSERFRRARAAVGLGNELQFRDLRRTAATELGLSGSTDREIMAVTGHTSPGIVATYVKTDGRFAISAQEKRERARAKSGKADSE